MAANVRGGSGAMSNAPFHRPASSVPDRTLEDYAARLQAEDDRGSEFTPAGEARTVPRPPAGARPLKRPDVLAAKYDQRQPEGPGSNQEIPQMLRPKR